jgi:hypothetical protein
LSCLQLLVFLLFGSCKQVVNSSSFFLLPSSRVTRIAGCIRFAIKGKIETPFRRTPAARNRADRRKSNPVYVRPERNNYSASSSSWRAMILAYVASSIIPASLMSRAVSSIASVAWSYPSSDLGVGSLSWAPSMWLLYIRREWLRGPDSEMPFERFDAPQYRFLGRRSPDGWRHRPVKIAQDLNRSALAGGGLVYPVERKSTGDSTHNHDSSVSKAICRKWSPTHAGA